MTGASTPNAERPLAATVVIASKDRPEMLIDTVNSILAARRVPSEIIVIDQSAEAHPEFAALGGRGGCEVRYIHSATSGASAARNVGIREASEDVVVMLDDDMLLQDDSLELLVAGGERGPRTVTKGRLLPAPAERPGLRQPPGALVLEDEPEVFRGRQSRQVVPGPNIALPRGVLLEIGGYDERMGPGTRFPAGEDHDLSLRLLDAGCEVRHIPEAVALHRSWRDQREIVRLRWRYARGVGGFYAKHASLSDRHTLELAAREARGRIRQGLTSLISAPRATATQLVTLAGLLFGALEWSLRYRLGRRGKAPQR
jgi:glycosyltransferase involved in cell wall biosynthesis